VPSLINEVPPGLLSLLGIKALGVNPSTLPDVLTPTIELRDLYVSGNGQFVSAQTSAALAVGVTGLASVPNVSPGELWIVDCIAAVTSAVLAAGTTVQYWVGIRDGATGAVYRKCSDTAQGTVGSRPGCGSSGGHFIMPANHSICVWCESLTLGVAPLVNVAFRYLALRT
jgi:hypothetical protein